MWYHFFMKAMWKGSISFALLNIPVNVYTATRSKAVSFHLLHDKDGTPLKYERFCPTDNVEVPWEETVHGYEYEKGKFVIVTEKDREKIPLKTTKSIDILRFVDEKDIDPIFYQKAYYIEPAKGGERAYALLRETMKGSSKAAVAKVAFREKEHVAIVRPSGDLLVLQTLLYQDEVANAGEVNIPAKVSLDEKEIALARELVKHFVGKFDISEYRDEFRDALMEIINAKIAGEEIKVPPRPKPEKVVNIMDALRKSLETTAAPKRSPQPRRKASETYKRKKAG